MILKLIVWLLIEGLVKGQAKSITGVNGGVAADASICSEIGVELLKQGGSAVDAGIGATLCQGVVYPFASGIGGGGFMLIKDPQLSNGIFIDFRETAPGLASTEMYMNNSDASTFGGLSVAIPSELRGLEAAHKLYGKLPWKHLVIPSIKLAKGHPAPHQLPIRLERKRDLIKQSPVLFQKYSKNGVFLNEGEIVRLPELANTLQIIADQGADGFYSGKIANSLVNTIAKNRGILSLNDLQRYKVNITNAMRGSYMNQTVHYLPPPSSGSVAYSILKMLESYQLQSELSPIMAHRLIESYKLGFAARSKLGDPKFINNSKLLEYLTNPREATKLITDGLTHEPKYYYQNLDLVFGNDPHGTSHVSALDKFGLGVSITSTINLDFGSKVLCPETGVLFNNEMDDFSTPGVPNAFGLPPSPNNYIEPYKRPLSSMTPMIIQSNVSTLVIGASGGSRIITSTVQTIFNLLQLNQSLSDAISSPRFHHQIFPNEIRIEPTGFTAELRQSLLSHNHTLFDIPFPESCVNAVHAKRPRYHQRCPSINRGWNVVAATDLRKSGIAAAY